MKLKYLLLIFTAHLIGCSTENDGKKSYSDVLSVLNEYSQQLKNKNGITRTRYGIGYGTPEKGYDGKIYQISLGYRFDQTINPEASRKLFYAIVDGLLEKINQKENLRDYFHHFPIGYEDLNISLSFDYENNGHLKKDEIQSIHIQFNEVFYQIVEQQKPIEITKRQLSPDIYMIDGYTPPYKCISRPVAEDLLLQDIETQLNLKDNK